MKETLSLSSECQDRRDFHICLTFTGILEIDVGCWLEFTRTFNWWDKHSLCMWFVIPSELSYTRKKSQQQVRCMVFNARILATQPVNSMNLTVHFV